MPVSCARVELGFQVITFKGYKSDQQLAVLIHGEAGWLVFCVANSEKNRWRFSV
jgi:hypothetical protein